MQAWGFERLLSGIENSECVKLRHELFEKFWGEAEGRIQVRAALKGGNVCTDGDNSPFSEKQIRRH